MQSSQKNGFPDIIDIGTILVTTIVMITAYFVDLSLSQSLVNTTSSIGKYTAKYGEIPGYLLVLLSAIIYGKSFYWEPQLINRDFFKVAGYSLLILVPSAFISYRLVDGQLPFILLSFLLPIPFIYLLWELYPQISYQNKTAAEFTLKTAIIVPLIFVNGLKTIWGRVRFRDLDSKFNSFTSWFVPQGITGDRSFPSGHSAMAWFLLCILFYVKDRKMRMLVVLLASLWGIFIAFGRLVIGAHYLSDVTFSASLTILVVNYFRRQQLSIIST